MSIAFRDGRQDVASTNRSPLLDTRERGEIARRRGSGQQTDTGRATSDGNGKQARRGRTCHISDAQGTMAKTREPRPAIDASYRHRRRYEASRTRPQIRHRPARRHEERGGRRSEERRGDKAKRASREARQHDRQRTGAETTREQAEAVSNTMTA